MTEKISTEEDDLEQDSKEKKKKIEIKVKSEKAKEQTLKITLERDIAMDFAAKVYKKFDKIIKSVILFGSSAKKTSVPESDIDIIIICDDVSIKWDQELTSWYREELGKVVTANPYKKSLHINTVKLSTWWQDLIRGDPIVINVIRYGDPLIDFGGFFIPLKVLLQEGKIKPTPEAIYMLLQRAPSHMSATKASMLAAIDGLYWAIVDSAHAALIASNIMPPSPEHIPLILKEQFVDTKMMKMKYVDYYRDIFFLAKDIIHGKTISVTGAQIDEWIVKTNEFVQMMAELIDQILKK